LRLLIFELIAAVAQIYDRAANDGGFDFAVKEPEADLFDARGQLIGTHLTAFLDESLRARTAAGARISMIVPAAPTSERLA
jgi:hypothetical protein